MSDLNLAKTGQWLVTFVTIVFQQLHSKKMFKTLINRQENLYDDDFFVWVNDNFISLSVPQLKF